MGLFGGLLLLPLFFRDPRGGERSRQPHGPGACQAPRPHHGARERV
jgi:hypothetical protein